MHAEREIRSTRNDTRVFFNEYNSDFIVAKEAMHSFCYLCSVGEHEHELRKPREESQVNQWMPLDNVSFGWKNSF